MISMILVNARYAGNFTWTYVKYIWYGLQQRVRALWHRELGIFGFIKSLFKLPFEAWVFTKLSMRDDYG